MNKQLINQHLAAFGLDETEIKLYLTLFQTGPISPLDLSRKSGVNRSKVYRYIERLTNRKLIEVTETGWGIKIRPANPQNLELIFKEREQELKQQKELLPAIFTELTALTQADDVSFEVKSYHGQEGLKQMLWNQLSEQEEILQFAYQTRNEIVGKHFAEKIREEQVSRKITLYEIENATDQGDFWYTKIEDFSKFYSARHIPAKILTIRQNLGIYGDTVSIMNWTEGTLSGLEILNPAFAKMQREIFWEFWRIAGKRKK